ncbi:MAG: hypothetical protein LC754_03745 [Acidobacteria bacterium]|nr:hypothetical protein [Acidobacteriota bacterium]
MTSATEDTSHPRTGHHAGTQDRQPRSAGAWVEPLRRSDVSRLWTELQRLVSNHPLVRASHSAGLLIEEGDRGSAYVDLTQELFVTLLAKSRFQHYLDTAMTDAEIECEIGQIELTNLLTAELRKRHPESYRLARRISTIIQSSANFRRMDNLGGGDDQLTGDEPHRRLVDRIYGLSEWRDDKSRRGAHELEQRAHLIPVRQRDTRMVGCTGDSQIIISNSDLEDLIVSVLEACDSPVDVRSLRSLVMSRLPVMDIYLVPLGVCGQFTERRTNDLPERWFVPPGILLYTTDARSQPIRVIRLSSSETLKKRSHGFFPALEGIRTATRTVNSAHRLTLDSVRGTD